MPGMYIGVYLGKSHDPQPCQRWQVVALFLARSQASFPGPICFRPDDMLLLVGPLSIFFFS